MGFEDQNTSGPVNPNEERVHDDNFVLNEIKRLQNSLQRCVYRGEGYRISKRLSLSDGEQLILHFVPVEAGGTIHIEPPSLLPEGAANIDVWENADPGANLIDDLEVHNMRYDSGQGTETPDATVQRVSSGGLDTTNADKTEESRAAADVPWNAPQGAPLRGLWRTIPVGETVTIVVTDDSGGAGNIMAADTVVYEGTILPE